jgi:hypothetical protein
MTASHSPQGPGCALQSITSSLLARFTCALPVCESRDGRPCTAAQQKIEPSNHTVACLRVTQASSKKELPSLNPSQLRAPQCNRHPAPNICRPGAQRPASRKVPKLPAPTCSPRSYKHSRPSSRLPSHKHASTAGPTLNPPWLNLPRTRPRSSELCPYLISLPRAKHVFQSRHRRAH